MAGDEDLPLVSHGLREDSGAPPFEGIVVGEGEDKTDAGTVVDGCVEECCELVEIGIECSGWWPGFDAVIFHSTYFSLRQSGRGDVNQSETQRD